MLDASRADARRRVEPQLAAHRRVGEYRRDSRRDVVAFPHLRVRVLWLLFALLGGMTKGGVALVPTILACAAWFALQFVYGSRGVGQRRLGHGVRRAHGGGFLAGILLGVALGFRRRRAARSTGNARDAISNAEAGTPQPAS